jgi:hypothetical protein
VWAIRTTSLCLALALAGCASPAVNAAGYRGKATHSAQDMSGIVASAQYAARLRLEGRLPQTVADTVVSDAEQDAQGVLSAFDSRQPPDHSSDQLRQDAEGALSDAGNELTDLRVAVRRDDRAQVLAALEALARTAPKLAKLAGTS